MKSNTNHFLQMLLALLIIFLGVTLIISQTRNNREGVFIHISSNYDEPLRVLMALKMADIMSEDKDVLVYFDAKGVEAVLKSQNNEVYKYYIETQKKIEKLKKKGVNVFISQDCLDVYECSDEDIMDGIEIASEADFFSFTKGRIITLDY